MLALLAAAVVTFAQPVTATCQNAATAQTQPVEGPSGSATLKVSAEDDHAKDTHLCMADYKLLVNQNSSSQPQQIELLTSDNDWGRKLSIQLSGFSSDGKEIVGILSEGGTFPAQMVFLYNRDDGNVSLFDLRKLAGGVTGTKCLVNAQVIGTIANGGIVIDLRSGKDCVHESRWVLNSVYGPLGHLPRHASVQNLYRAGSDAPSQRANR